MRRFILCALAAVCLASGAELAGRWKGAVNRPDGSAPATVFLILRQQGDTISGDIGYNPDETAPISNVKREGDKLSFDVETSEVLYKIKLAVADESLRGDVVVNRDGRDAPPVKLELSREK